MEKRPELHSGQVEGVLCRHCCETAPPEHHRVTLGLASVAWNPGKCQEKQEEIMSAGFTGRWEIVMETYASVGEEDR